MFLYIGRDTSKTYIMRLVKNEAGYSSFFSKIANVKDSPEVLTLIQSHIEDKKNPHLDDKRDVDLAQVENLPLATMEDIICNIPTRKYITLTQLYAYMKRFKTGKKEISEIYENFTDKTVGKRLQTLFSPCGAWDDNVDVDKIEMCKAAPIVTEVPTTTAAPSSYSVVPNVLVLHGGETVTFNVTTEHVADGTILYWSTILMDIGADKFENTALNGEVTITDNKGTVTLTLKAAGPVTLPPVLDEALTIGFIVGGEVVNTTPLSRGDVVTIQVSGENFDPFQNVTIETFSQNDDQVDNDIKELISSGVEASVDEHGSFNAFFEWEVPMQYYNGSVFVNYILPVKIFSRATVTTIPNNLVGPSNEIIVTLNNPI
jgi:hypothetical protein